jgi:hypothetical protein
MVRSLSSDALLWRIVSLLGTLDEISLGLVKQTTNKPVNQICQWERGKVIHYTSCVSSLSVVRICIDWRGVKRLERFTANDTLNMDTGSCFAFIIGKSEDFDDVIAEFRVR